MQLRSFVFLVLPLEVFEICPAEMTAQLVEMKINVTMPIRIERFEQIGPDGAALWTAWTLQLPGFGKKVFKTLGRMFRAYR